jgi:hypothetical protein
LQQLHAEFEVTAWRDSLVLIASDFASDFKITKQEKEQRNETITKE